jgi:hypothetical protein
MSAGTPDEHDVRQLKRECFYGLLPGALNTSALCQPLSDLIPDYVS